MNRKVQVDDLARYVNAAHDVQSLIVKAIQSGAFDPSEELVLALNEFAEAAEVISDVTTTLDLESNKIKLN